jgi:hypothetical protein
VSHKDIGALRRRIVDDIRGSFPVGTYNLTVEQVALFLAISEGHLRNQISDETCPVQSMTLNGRRVIPLTYLADYQLAEMLSQERPKIGRPSKASRRVKSILSSVECNHG